MPDRKIIAVDIDDVIAAETEGVRQFINQEYGEAHTAEDYLREGEYWTYWQDIWDVSSEEAATRLEAFLKSPIKDNLKLVHGAMQAINMLKQRYELVIVTSRYGRQLETTIPWVEKHFPKTFSRVEFVAIRGEGATKASVCKEIGATYLIDDNVEHCKLAAKQGIKALLFGNYGWSKNVSSSPGIIRVDNWQEVLEYFNAA